MRQNLDAMRQELKAAVDAKDLKKAEELYHKISYELKTRTVILDRVYGQTTRELLRSTFKADAQALRDSLIYDITVAMKAREAQDAVKAGNLDKAKAALDQVNQYVSKVTDAFKAELQKAAQDANAAYEAALTPKVESVSAINTKQIEVKFNKELDETTAETVANYLYDGNPVAGTPELQADKKTVIITLNTVATNKSAHTLKVQNVKTADLKATIESDVFSFFINDTVAPEVKSTKVLANGDVEIQFSEPLKTAPTVVRVDGNPVSIATFTAGDSKITIPAAQIASVAEGATATVYIAGATDFADLEMKSYEGSFVKVVDKTKPAVSSVKQVENKKFQIEFTEDLGTDQLAAADITLIDKNGNTLAPGTDYTVAAVTVNGVTSKKVFEVTLVSDIYSSNTLDSHALTLVVKGNTVNDVAGNTNDAYSTSVVMTRDKVAPKFVSSSVSTNKETIEVKFDKAVTPTTGAASKVIVTDKDGVRYTVDSITQKAPTGEDAKVLVIDLIPSSAPTQTMANGEYTLQFQAGVAADSLGNTSEAFTTKVVVGDTTDTTKPVATLDASSTVNSFVINFGEEVTNSALNLANYKLDNKALPAGTAIYFTSAAKNQVKIELPEGSVNVGDVTNGTNAILTVANVADKAGNIADTKNFVVKIGDNTPATLTAAQVIGNNILKLTFNENIKSTGLVVANVLAGLEIKSSVGTVSANSANTNVSVSGKDVILTFDTADNFDEVVAASTVTVKTLDGTPANGKVEGILDANGLGVKANVSVTATK